MRPNLRSATVSLLLLALFALLMLPGGSARAEEPGPSLDPLTLTKYLDALPIPGPMPMAGPNFYEIGAWEIHQQLHSQLPPTYLFGYGPTQATAGYPAATIEAVRGVPIDIHWTNHLGFNHPVSFAFDPTLEHAITTTGIPITPHVHGAEVEPPSDGGPLTWFTAGFAETGPDWKKQTLHYANTQLPATIWYHDHAFGFTRHNVYAGLAGFYIVRDPGHEPVGLPSGRYEIPLAIQDKSFSADGQLWYPIDGDNPEHPVWTPEFFGNVMLVNGKIWPYLNVEPRKYRFRILDGSNARFFSLALADRVTSAPGPAFYQIGTDGGYLAEPVLLNDPNNAQSPRLLLGPGERADVVIDFSGYAPGTAFLLRNTAKAPYPRGDAANPQTTGQVMLVRVVAPTGPDDSVLPAQLATVTRLSNPTVTRTMTLNELQGQDGPLAVLLNGQTFMNGEPARPVLGTTEMWEIVNMTADTHPIHLHLVQYQLLNRQKFNLNRYEEAFEQANPTLPTDHYAPVSVTPYLKGKPIPADPNERGWKDTYRMNPGEVTRVLVRFGPQDESPSYAFDATASPGYVWHCHILEHEENDMMQRYELVAAPPAALAAASLTPGASITRLQTALLSPAPHPLNGSSELRFTLAKSGNVELHLYNIAGRQMATLARGWYEAGEHHLAWVAGTVPAGVYLLQFRTEARTQVRKIVVAR